MPAAKIMIVDDEPDIVQALSLRLRSVGYDVVVATDGMSATRTAVQEQPDLIILDIGIPGGDGHTVAERLKNNARTMTIPVIYLTARDTQIDMKKASAMGAAGYVIKPYKAERLLDLVAQAVGGVPAPVV